MMVPSPCINVCKMDAGTGLCAGCFRTLDEIAAWSSAGDETRLDILDKVAQRRREQAPRESDLRSEDDKGEG
ncbi:MAG TPA: DUF1289 domain-containing protein [Rhodocyclaceae bacterium]|nr:DUF1289 domain-containing protein [Rhodocyclaceae bacterium]